MISFPAGLLALSAVLAFALGDMKMSVLLNPHSMILVIGGTFGVLALSTPLRDVIGLARGFLDLWRPQRSARKVHTALMELAQRRDAQSAVSHPLLRYAQELWEQGVDSDMFVFLLNQRREEQIAASERVVASVRNLAKYPPALGMTGTVIGMVSLFSNLTPETRAKIGPSLALAMTATFYGLILSNMILMPVADRLGVLHLSRRKNLDYVYKALLLIQRGEPQTLIQEEINVSAA